VNKDEREAIPRRRYNPNGCVRRSLRGHSSIIHSHVE
jgi:hypothetical protein